MLRRLPLLLLLVCLLAQSWMRVATYEARHAQEEVAHMALHSQVIPHHHEDPGFGFHQDSSDASVEHVLGDASVQAPVLLGAPPLATLEASTFIRHELLVHRPYQPFIGLLDRPPKSSS
jgi:hypothetical protein